MRDFIFEKYYNYQLKQWIKKDFLPNKFLCAYSSDELNDLFHNHITYISNIEEELNKSFYNDEDLESLYKNKYKEEELAVKLYTGFVGEKMNRYLRNNNLEKPLYYEYLLLLSDLISNFYTSVSIIGLRRMPSFVFDKLKKGDIYSEKGFLGCSIKLDVRYEESLNRSKPLQNEALLLLKIPKGTNAFYAEAISKRKEFELIIQKGLNYRIEKNIKIFNNRIVVASIAD